MARHELFISWSGKRSMKIAELLQIWIPTVIQVINPFISTKDVDKGSFWFTEINKKLSEISIGIVCLTAENRNKPWIIFETGALIKGLSTNRVCTLLIDLDPTDIEGPLAWFNHTILEKESIFRLLETINNSLGEEQLKPLILQESFNNSWDRFIEKCKTIITETECNKSTDFKRSNDEIIAEILKITRSLDKKTNELLSLSDTSTNFCHRIIINSQNNMSIISDISEILNTNKACVITLNAEKSIDKITFKVFLELSENIDQIIKSISVLSGVIDVNKQVVIKRD